MTSLPALREAAGRIDVCACPTAYRGMLCIACVADARQLKDALPALLDEVERLRDLSAREQAKNFQYEAEKAEPGTLRAALAAARAVLESAEQIPLEFLIPEPGIIAITVDEPAWRAWQGRTQEGTA